MDKALSAQLPRLSCFASSQGKAETAIAGDNRVEVRLAKEINADRVRLNCTMPGPAAEADDTPRWRWFGMMLVNPVAAETSDESDEGETGENGLSPPVEE